MLAGLLVAGAALIACGGRTESQSGCASAVVWRGETRLGLSVRGDRIQWPPIERTVQARVPACNDGGGSSGDSRSVQLSQFQGVAPEVALALADDAGVDTLFLGAGYFPQVPGHPLHEALYRFLGAPDETRGRRCPRVPQRSGRLRRVDGAAGWVSLDDESIWWVDAGTVIRAPTTPGRRGWRRASAYRSQGCAVQPGGAWHAT